METCDSLDHTVTVLGIAINEYYVTRSVSIEINTESKMSIKGYAT